MKKVWMLCWGLVAMMTVMAVNLSSVDAGEALFEPPRQTDPDDANLTRLIGDYEITAVYRGGGEFIDGRDTHTVIRIGYSTDAHSYSLTGEDYSRLYGMAIEAPSDSRFSGVDVEDCYDFFWIRQKSMYSENPTAIATAELEYLEPSAKEGEYAGHVVIYYSPELYTDMVVNGNVIKFYNMKTHEPVFEVCRIN